MQLISQDEVLSLAFSGDDAIDTSHVRAARIEAAQLRYIRPAFGNAMYREMILEQYRDFVSGYIKPALAHFVRYELIGELAVRASDRGVVRPSFAESEQSETSIRNDREDRKDTSRSESSRQSSGTKSSTETTSRQTSDQSTSKRTEDEQRTEQVDDQQTLTQTSTDKQTVQSTSTTQGDTSGSLTEKKETDQTNGTKETLTQTLRSEEESTQSLRTDTASGTQKVDGEVIGSVETEEQQADLATKNATVSTTLAREDTDTSRSTRLSLGAATAEEWQLLSRQALRDARTFLRYAVEYVEANRNRFPNYDPASGLAASGDRRCIGGIIL
ncbi:MAG: hypothetical protein K2G93_01245 [Rikenella sp.]|nr:hypothetical protein [Rikenella sp.]